MKYNNDTLKSYPALACYEIVDSFCDNRPPPPKKKKNSEFPEKVI